MTIVCWTCGAWYDNAIFAWSCPHQRLFPQSALTQPTESETRGDADHPSE